MCSAGRLGRGCQADAALIPPVSLFSSRQFPTHRLAIPALRLCPSRGSSELSWALENLTRLPTAPRSERFAGAFPLPAWGNCVRSLERAGQPLLAEEAGCSGQLCRPVGQGYSRTARVQSARGTICSCRFVKPLQFSVPTSRKPRPTLCPPILAVKDSPESFFATGRSKIVNP